jgi:hypothetical protein
VSRRPRPTGARGAPEKNLEERLLRRRSELLASAGRLSATLRSCVDVTAPVRRDPFGSVAAALSAGLLAGCLVSLASGRRKPRQTCQAPASGAASLAVRLRLLESLIPLAGALVSMIQARPERAGPGGRT